ncbi:MAG: glycosyl hydrolase family 17 [Bacteroidetes bacterium]|nr:glycosyl hydrolase family 17 [Bacteroidota bacterium]
MSLIPALLLLLLVISCNDNRQQKNQHQETLTEKEVTAQDILGNPDYQAISYGGYRQKTREIQPTIEELKEDMRILQALKIKVLRTYNVQLPQASNLLKVIHQLKEEDASFEMYVMLGAWIDCENAWTGHQPNHDKEELEANTSELQRVVDLANQYPDIVKILAVGNEAMVKWAEEYYVQPGVILKWVNHLQDLKRTGKLPKELWITSSDNFASWGGGDTLYHTEDLKQLIKEVDFVSIHTYPMHDTHYNPQFWGLLKEEEQLSDKEKNEAAVQRAIDYAMLQYERTSMFIQQIDPGKPIHIGETGWASASNKQYGPNGSKATDELKQALYYEGIRAWTNQEKLSCFYFEAFDEIWKDAHDTKGSENNFGLFNLEGNAKYALWDLVDQGAFEGLTRDGNPITKTYGGEKDALLEEVYLPAVKSEISVDY